MWKIVLIISVFTVAKVIGKLGDSKKKLEALKMTLDEYCKDNGADGKADEVLEAITTAVRCIEKEVDLNTLRREFAEAKESSDESLKALNDVMEEHCRKSSAVLKKCVHTMSDTTVQCMNERVRGHIKGYNNAFDGLVDYACRKDDGENINIALFVHQNGIQCIDEHKYKFKDCTEDLKNNVFWEHCDDFDEFANCVKDITQQCPKRVVGKLIANLLNAIRANSPCGSSYKNSNKGRVVRSRLKRELLTESTTKITVMHQENLTIYQWNIVNIPLEKHTDRSLELEDKNTTIVPTASYENETDWLWLSGWLPFGSEDENRTITTTTPYKELLGLLRNGNEKALAQYRLDSEGMSRYRWKIRKYCMDHGGSDADFDRMIREMGNCIRCLQKLVDPVRVKVELEMARPFGKKGIKRLFVKYCQKSWVIKECIYSLTFKAVPLCMSDEAENYLTAYNSIIDMTINFWCYRGGDRLALYYADDGPKCFSSQFGAMQKCGDIFETTVFWKHCDKFPKFIQCIKDAMRKCSTPHPARIVEGLLTVIYRRSTCRGGRDRPWITRLPPTGDYNY